MSKVSFDGWVVTPAYGHDYTSVASVLKALNAGIDFRAHLPNGQSTLCSIRDMADGYVEVRYAKRQRVVEVVILNGKASA